MGADIHSVIQGQWLHTSHLGEPIENPDHTCWHTVSEGFHERDYQLFGTLAGVRAAADFDGVLRGPPENFLLRDECYHPIPQDFRFRKSFRPDHKSPWEMYMGEHSFTWYSMEELGGFGKNAEIMEIYHVMRELGISYRDYKNWRIVIGFDS